MRAVKLLKHFGRMVEAQDVIPGLRRAIRGLAVRGKLVRQAADRSVQDQLSSPANAERLRPFEIPTSWAWTSVGSSGKARLGKMLDKAKNRGVLRRYLRNVNVRWFDFDLSDVSEMRFEDDELAEFTLKVGDVLVCEGGEPGRAAVWDGRETGLLFQKAIHRIRFSESVDPYYFVIALRDAADDDRLSGLLTGVTFKHLTGQGLSRFRFPLPLVHEQHRIVAKVDELMALCDELEAAQAERERRRDRVVVSSLRRISRPAENDETLRAHARFHLDHLPRLVARVEHVQELRQGILDLAVQGRLVEQRTGEQAASGLGSLGMVADGADLPCAVPANWFWCPLGNLLGEDSRNGYSRKPDGNPNGVPILRISAGTTRRDWLIDEGDFKMIGDVTDRDLRQYSLLPGDLLACRFNGNRHFVGRLSMFAGYSGSTPIYPDKLIRLRLSPKAGQPKLFALFAASEQIRREIEKYCATTVGNWGISATNLKQVRVPVPPLDEQKRLLTTIDELMATCDQLEAALKTAQAARARLLEAVLHEALSPG